MPSSSSDGDCSKTVKPKTGREIAEPSKSVAITTTDETEQSIQPIEKGHESTKPEPNESSRKDGLSDQSGDEKPKPSNGILGTTFDIPIENKYSAEPQKQGDAKNLAEKFPNLKNGHQSRHGKQVIVTTNTCAFDTVFNSFASIYSNNSFFREQANSSKIRRLIKSLFCVVDNPSEQNIVLQHVYDKRNLILKDLYTNWCKNSVQTKNDTISIDCLTGIGGLFSRICLHMDSSLASSIEKKTCKNCKTQTRVILPFIKTTGDVIDFAKVGDYIDVKCKQRICTACREKCDTEKQFNNVVVLEVEQRSKLFSGAKVLLKNICSTLEINNEKYSLCSVMHHSSQHFIAYTRENGKWKCYDDLKKSARNVDDLIQVNPFMLCFVATNPRDVPLFASEPEDKVNSISNFN